MRNSFWFPFRFWVAFTDVVGVEATPGDMRGGGRGAIATSWETSRGQVNPETDWKEREKEKEI